MTNHQATFLGSCMVVGAALIALTIGCVLMQEGKNLLGVMVVSAIALFFGGLFAALSLNKMQHQDIANKNKG
jgi:hypothetical protein